MNNMYQNGGFYWFMGVVEDRKDPEALGRCRIRVAGYHTADKLVLPTEDLPWAMPLMPITSASMSGVGHAPVGPVEGTWVLGFFLDGDDCQIPVMLGTFPGRAEALNLFALLEKLVSALSLPLIFPVVGLAMEAIPVLDAILRDETQVQKDIADTVEVSNQ